MATATERLEKLEKQIGFLKFIIGGLSAVLVVGFTAGIIWAQFLQYEQRVKEHSELITNIQRDIRVFKRNLQEMGDRTYSYLVEVAADIPESWQCEKGNVVTGIRYDGGHNKLWMRCASLGRAAYSPDGSRPDDFRHEVEERAVDPAAIPGGQARHVP
jgi:hypothetical protein